MICIAKHGDDRGEHQAEVGFLCKPAFTRLERQIAELPALASWLRANIGSGGTSALDPNKVSRSGDDPLPIKADVFDHLELIAFTLTSWSLLVSEERELHGPASSHPEATAAFLGAHLSWAAEQTWVDDLAVEVEDLTRIAHQLVPSRPEVHRLGAPCPDCGASELTRRDGADYIGCGSCGKLITEKEYGWFAKTEAERQRDASGWLTLEHAAGQLGLNPRTVRTWAMRDRLLAVACVVLPGEKDTRLRVLPAEVDEVAKQKDPDGERKAS